jgi:hypothetical protein
MNRAGEEYKRLANNQKINADDLLFLFEIF